MCLCADKDNAICIHNEKFPNTRGFCSAPFNPLAIDDEIYEHLAPELQKLVDEARAHTTTLAPGETLPTTVSESTEATTIEPTTTGEITTTGANETLTTTGEITTTGANETLTTTGEITTTGANETLTTTGEPLTTTLGLTTEAVTTLTTTAGQ